MAKNATEALKKAHNQALDESDRACVWLLKSALEYLYKELDRAIEEFKLRGVQLEEIDWEAVQANDWKKSSTHLSRKAAASGRATFIVQCQILFCRCIACNTESC